MLSLDFLKEKGVKHDVTYLGCNWFDRLRKSRISTALAGIIFYYD